MKDAPRLRGGLAVRSLALVVGLVVIALAIAVMLESGFGVPPWDVLHVGISLHTPLSVGQASVLVGLVVLFVGWGLGAIPGVGTVANAVEIGFLVDVFLDMQAVQDLSEAVLGVRLVLIALGVAAFGIGSALYIGAGLGAGPRDGLMLALSHRTGHRIAVVRAVMELVVLVSGIALGGPFGPGTVVFALAVGPAVEGSFWLLVRTGLARPTANAAPQPA